MNVLYGLIGASELLREKSLDQSYVFAGVTESKFNEVKSEDGIEAACLLLSSSIHHNLTLTENIIDFLPKINISHYRISNSIFSILSDFTKNQSMSIDDLPDHLEIANRIRQIGFLARQNDITLSVYPEYSHNLVTDDDESFSLCEKELNFYSWFFETAGFPSNASNPIIITPKSEPTSDSHDSAVDLVKSFYSNLKKLNQETQKRLVVQNKSSGFWNCVNLFKYFHVYLHEKFNHGMSLSYFNLADDNNPGAFTKGGDTVEAEVNIGAFHETWMGVVPIFLWSELGPKGGALDFLSGPIPNYNYNIKWECDVRKRDKAIIRYTMPEDEDKVTEEVIMTITKNKYKKSKDFSRSFNALYDG
jgi:hypothetical protein